MVSLNGCNLTLRNCAPAAVAARRTLVTIKVAATRHGLQLGRQGDERWCLADAPWQARSSNGRPSEAEADAVDLGSLRWERSAVNR